MLTLALRAIRLALQLAICAALPLTAALASSYNIVYSFTGGADGANPSSGLTPGMHGELYGTTSDGGAVSANANGYGTIFKLDATGKLTTIYTFGALNAVFPETGVSLIRGALYGSANDVLYSVNTDGTGFAALHTLTQAEGFPQAGLMQPAAGGGEFGVATYAGPHNGGSLFYLTASNKFSIVHYFPKGATDGIYPNELVSDGHGNLFGSTASGGGCTAFKVGCGTIFEYTPSTRAYKVLYSFENGADGNTPMLGGVAPDGSLYGATEFASSRRYFLQPGVLFTLTPGATGYTFAILTKIVDKYYGDVAGIPPTRSPNGTLVGEVSRGTYTYQNGKYTIHYGGIGTSYGPLFVPKGNPNAFIATSVNGGAPGVCTLPGIFGCGMIFSGH